MHTHVCIIYIHIYIYIYKYTCKHIYAHIYTYIHTHTHMYTYMGESIRVQGGKQVSSPLSSRSLSAKQPLITSLFPQNKPLITESISGLQTSFVALIVKVSLHKWATNHCSLSAKWATNYSVYFRVANKFGRPYLASCETNNGSFVKILISQVARQIMAHLWKYLSRKLRDK